MKAGDYRRALAALPFGTFDDLTSREPFLVLSPHPDDETLGCGGLLSAASDAGVMAQVLMLTDGAASHPRSPSYPPSRLAALRRDEARRALACLGLAADRMHGLGLPDAATPAEGPAFDAAVDGIAAIAGTMDAHSLFVTWGHDPHCDHETAFAMGRAVAARVGSRLWAYPVWGLHLPQDHDIDAAAPTGFRFDIAALRDRKRRAIDCYASQMTELIADDPSGFRFTEAQLQPFLGDSETFIEVT